MCRIQGTTSSARHTRVDESVANANKNQALWQIGIHGPATKFKLLTLGEARKCQLVRKVGCPSDKTRFLKAQSLYRWTCIPISQSRAPSFRFSRGFWQKDTKTGIARELSGTTELRHLHGGRTSCSGPSRAPSVAESLPPLQCLRRAGQSISQSVRAQNLVIRSNRSSCTSCATRVGLSRKVSVMRRLSNSGDCNFTAATVSAQMKASRLPLLSATTATNVRCCVTGIRAKNARRH